jgi:hypothetical protein
LIIHIVFSLIIEKTSNGGTFGVSKKRFMEIVGFKAVLGVEIHMRTSRIRQTIDSYFYRMLGQHVHQVESNIIGKYDNFQYMSVSKDALSKQIKRYFWATK